MIDFNIIFIQKCITKLIILKYLSISLVYSYYLDLFYYKIYKSLLKTALLWNLWNDIFKVFNNVKKTFEDFKNNTRLQKMRTRN